MITQTRYVVKARIQAGFTASDLWLAQEGRWTRSNSERESFLDKDQACRCALDACCSGRPNRPDLTRYAVEIHEVKLRIDETILNFTRVV